MLQGGGVTENLHINEQKLNKTDNKTYRNIQDARKQNSGTRLNKQESQNQETDI